MSPKYCFGCEDNFYNGNNPYGVQECWHLEKAKREPRLIVGVWQNPPYEHEPVLMPVCYRKKGSVLVKPEAITPEGYWR